MRSALNRKILRKFILQEMKKSILREQSSPSSWEEIDLSGVEVTGRPRLQGKYRVISNGSFNDLQGDLEFEVIEYNRNSNAVGTKFTLDSLVDYHKGLGAAADYTWEDHDLWPNLVRAAETRLASTVSDQSDDEEVEADSAMVDTGDETEESEDIASVELTGDEGQAGAAVEDDLELDSTQLAQTTLDRVQGVDIDLDESDIPISLENIEVDAAVPERRASRIAATLARELAGTTVSIPLGVGLYITVTPESLSRARVRVGFNGIEEDLLGDDTTSSLVRDIGGFWDRAEPIMDWDQSDEEWQDEVERYERSGRDGEPQRGGIVVGYTFVEESEDDDTDEMQDVRINNYKVSESEISNLLSSIGSAYTKLTNRQKRSLIDAESNPTIGSTWPIVISLENADENADL